MLGGGGVPHPALHRSANELLIGTLRSTAWGAVANSPHKCISEMKLGDKRRRSRAGWAGSDRIRVSLYPGRRCCKEWLGMEKQKGSGSFSSFVALPWAFCSTLE